VSRTTDTVVLTVDVPSAVVDVVRDRVFDILEVSPELRADGRPIADAVADRLDANG
jgi:hypothetical protein